MAARDIIKGDIIEVSYLLIPAGRKMPDDLKQFTARAYLVQPFTEENKKDWLEVWWEQRSANRKGVVLVPPTTAPPDVLRKLPRVKLIKRPR